MLRSGFVVFSLVTLFALLHLYLTNTTISMNTNIDIDMTRTQLHDRMDRSLSCRNFDAALSRCLSENVHLQLNECWQQRDREQYENGICRGDLNWCDASQQQWDTDTNTNADTDTDTGDRCGLQLKNIMFMSVTGEKNHRKKADILMGTWGHFIPPQHLLFASDSLDADHLLPNVVNVLDGLDIETQTRILEPEEERLWYTPEWRSSQLKWVMGLKATHEHVMKHNLHDQIRWYVIFDDDAIIQPYNLLRMLSTYNSSEYHFVAKRIPMMRKGGPGCNGTRPDWSLESCNHEHTITHGGAGYYLSAPIVDTLSRYGIEKCQGYHNLFHSDHTLTRCILDVCSIDVEHSNLLASHEVEMKDFKFDRSEEMWTKLSRQVTLHYVVPWQQYYMRYRQMMATENGHFVPN